MHRSVHQFFPLSILGLGLETLPWIALAMGSAFFLPSPLQDPIPASQILIPGVILIGGGLAILGRRAALRRLCTKPVSQPSTGAFSSFQFQGDSNSNSSTQNEEDFSIEEARQDPLTELANRSVLLSEVAHRLESEPSEDRRLALLSITLDEYRDVTDSFGYNGGQELIKTAANRIQNTIPPAAVGARIAEDAFAVLLTEVTTEDAREMGQLLLDTLNSAFQIEGHSVPIAASIGLATQKGKDTPFSSAEKLLQASYSAMLQVQRQGGRTLKVFKGEVAERTQWLRKRERLRQAIRQNELTIHYQPIVHLASQEIVGAEALVRWNHPERGLLPPSAFLPLAEETDLIGDIDRWVFTRALQRASAWTTSPNGPVDWVSVNVSPQSTEGGLQEWCREQLRGVPLADGGLHLEITERWALKDERTLRPLRDDGIRLSIDDFGTGYSSLRYLRTLDADVLKIDQEFIQGLGHDPKTTAIVQFLLNLALRLDVEVIAEGVETEKQEATLRELGCAMAQGFYFSEPVPPEMLTNETNSIAIEESAHTLDDLQPA